jgi:hypothetical protein
MTLAPKWPVNFHHLFNSCQWQLNQIKQWYQFAVSSTPLRSEALSLALNCFLYVTEREILQPIEFVKLGNSNSFSRSI